MPIRYLKPPAAPPGEISALEQRLRGDVEDAETYEPMTEWQPPTRIGRGIKRTLDFGFTPIEFIRKPLHNIGESLIESATEETNPALRYLKAYPGAVAETLGEMATPINAASFLTGPGALGRVGMAARGVTSGAQLGEGIPKTVHGITEGNVGEFMGGAAETALGALGVYGDLAGVLRKSGELRPWADVLREAQLRDNLANAQRQMRNARPGLPPASGGLPPAPEVPPSPGTPPAGEPFDELGRLLGPAPEPPPFQEGEIIPPPGLPPGNPPGFFGGRNGLSPDINAADRRPVRGLLPERGSEASLGMPEAPSYPPEASNRAMTPEEFFGARELQQGPPVADLSDIELMLRGEYPPPAEVEQPLAGFEAPTFGRSRVQEPSTIDVTAQPGTEAGARNVGEQPYPYTELEQLMQQKQPPADIRPPDEGAPPAETGLAPRPEPPGGPAGEGLQAAEPALTEAEQSLVFRRRPAGENVERFTPEVLRQLQRIYDEMDNFRYVGRTWTEAPRKTGNAAGGDYDIVAGAAGAPVYNDILGEAPLNLNIRTGKLARAVGGTRQAVMNAIKAAIEGKDIPNNLAEGAVRVAELRAKGEMKGLSKPSLPDNWDAAPIPDELSNLIDELAAEPETPNALEATAEQPTREPVSVDDLLDTGEQQPRLPEAGQVRELETPTPEFEAPFSLTGEASTAPDALERSLFGEGMPREELPAEGARALPSESSPGGELQAGQSTELAPLEDLNDLITRHEVRSPEAARKIGQSMQRVGYKGRPILVVNDAGRRIAWTGVHRLEGAKQAGLKPSDVNFLEVDAAPLREAGYNIDELTTLGKKKRIAALRAAGLEDAASLLEEERGAAQSRRAVEARSESVPERLPPNVFDYLTKQLKYTSDQIADMPTEEAMRIGRENIVNPNQPAPPAPTPIQSLPEASELPSMEGFEENRRARGLQRRAAVQRTAVEPREPGSVEGAPPPKTPAERQAAGETLTSKEREALGMPQESRPREPVSLREQGSSPRQIAKREKQLNAWMDDPTPENFARWVNEITGQAERVNTKQLKGGTGTEGAPPRGQGGEYLASSPFPGFQIFSDPAMLRKIGQLFTSNEAADRMIRAAVGGTIGAFTDEDEKLKGAVYGAILGMVGPQVARAVANDFVMLAKGRVPRGLPEVYARGREGDIGVIERIFGTKARTIPEETAAVRPGVEAFQRVQQTGRVSSRTPLFGERFGESGPAFQNGRLQVRQSQFLKPEIQFLRERAKTAKAGGKKRLAGYLNAFADELAGTMTQSEKFLSQLGIKPRHAGLAATEISNQIYRAGMAFNVSSAVVNRIAQPLLVAPYVGLKNLWKAYAPLSEAERGLSNIRRPIDIEEIEMPAVGMLRRFDDLASSLMRFTDNHNRQGAYAAAHLAAEQTGATNAQAFKFARDVSEKTQGLLGMISGNPSWRGPVIKTIKPFTKYPILFAEWLNDVATHPDPRVRWRTATMAAGVWAFSQATGLDVWDMLASGARWGGSAILRAAMDVYGHATNAVRDHKLFEMPGEGFLDSDIGNLAYPIGVHKTVDTLSRFYRQGTEPHTVRTPAGAPETVSPAEDASNYFGLKTTRQTERQRLLNQSHAEETRAMTEQTQDAAQAKREYYRALDAGDLEGERAALAKMTPATRRSVAKQANQDRFERLRRQTPRSRRPALMSKYGELERLLESPR